MSFKKGFLVIVALVCTLMTANVSSAAGDPWRAKMSELSTALSEAIPCLYAASEQNCKDFSGKVKRLYEISNQLDGKFGHVTKPDSDPALPYIAGLLREDIARANQSIQEGHVEYAKSVVRFSVAYCIACHTRTRMGTEFPLIKAFSEPLKHASWIEKLEFQTASRQFDPVLAEVTKQLESPGTTGISPMDLDRASRMALSVIVRFKQDPDRAMFLTEAIIKSKSATFAMKESAKQWKKDIRVWQDEKNKKYATDKDLIEAARPLAAIDAADVPLGGHNEVRFLRASALMHDLLRRFPKSNYAAESLYYIGLSYDALREIGLWSLQEMYYLACIDKAPNTEQSAKCFRRFEESVTLGYSGSSGTHMPSAVRRHLDGVKQKAIVKKE